MFLFIQVMHCYYKIRNETYEFKMNLMRRAQGGQQTSTDRGDQEEITRTPIEFKFREEKKERRERKKEKQLQTPQPPKNRKAM